MRKIARTTSMTEQVYSILLEEICNCTLEPNTRIVQEEIAANIGVSRQPVQQALQLLRADGLLLEAEGRGMVVAPLDAGMIVQHYQIRCQMDRLAAGLVSERMRAPDSAAFRADFARQAERILEKGVRANETGETAKAVALDVEFHTLIYNQSGNSLIARAAAPHWSYLRRVMQRVLLHAGRGSTVWSEHEAILQQLLNGEAEVMDAVEVHITGAQEALISLLQSEGIPHRSATE